MRTIITLDNGKKYTIRSYARLKTSPTEEIGWNKVMWNAPRIIENGNALRVYLLLCEYYNIENNYSFPTIEKIMNELNLSKPTVINAISYLEGKGLVKKESNVSQYSNHTHNIYRVYYLVEYEEMSEEDKEKEEALQQVEELLDKLGYNMEGVVKINKK